MNDAEILKEIISINQIGYWIHNIEKKTVKCSHLAKELLEIKNSNQYIFIEKDLTKNVLMLKFIAKRRNFRDF